MLTNLISIVFCILSGCADISKTYDFISPPTNEELTMRLFESGCTDIKWKRPNGILPKEYWKLIRIKRIDKNNGGECQIQCTGGQRLSGEERILNCNQEIEAEVVKQRREEDDKYAEISRKNAIAKEKSEKVYSNLALKGYTPMSIDDFQLDSESLPIGKKIYVDGFYEIFGDIQYLVRFPTAANPQQYQIPLLSVDADRESRKLLIKMQQSCVAGRSACRIKVIGKVARCKITFLSASKNKVCISMDTFSY